MNKEAGKMRSIRRNKEGIGFVILTTLLSLTFIVSIVYAGAISGIKNDVQWSIYAGDLSYNSATDTSSSDHWIYVTNNSNIPVYLWYELKHSIDNTWEIKEFPPGNKLIEISPLRLPA